MNYIAPQHWCVAVSVRALCICNDMMLLAALVRTLTTVMASRNIPITLTCASGDAEQENQQCRAAHASLLASKVNPPRLVMIVNDRQNGVTGNDRTE